MKKKWWIFCILFLFLGCTTSGEKFIHIAYLGDQAKTETGLIGMAPFQDKRGDMDVGYVGYRILMDNSQETYIVQGMNLAYTLKDVVEKYFEKKGFTVKTINQWEPLIDGVMNSGGGFKQIVAGRINKFECRARKTGITTDMVLDIDLTLFLGSMEKKSLKTIPVALTLERTEITFTPQKLEQFVNQSLEEVIQKALVF